MTLATSLPPDFDALSAVPAVGLPQPVRSHFDAQDFVESGTPGVKSTRDGYLNRALAALPEAPSAGAFRAVALQPTLPRALAGDAPALALDSLQGFRLRTPGRTGAGNPEAELTRAASAGRFSAV